MLGVDVLGFLHHAQRLVLAARRHARGASFTEIRHEDREHAAAAGLLLLRRREDRVRLLERHRHLVDDGKELALRLIREAVDDVGHLPDDVRERSGQTLRHRIPHEIARALLDLGQRSQHLLPLARIAHVARDGRVKDRLQIL